MIGGPNLSRAIVTGCAGFIGSNLVDDLLLRGIQVVGIDNLSTGKLEFLQSVKSKSNFEFLNLNLQDADALPKLFNGADIVFHLAANADVRLGPNHPRRDLEQNTIVTHNVLEAMRLSQVQKIVFSSTGSIYGNSGVSPTPEDSPFPIQTSLYGASKLAGEALIEAYCESFGFQSWIFRFVSILGPRYSHGHVFDFYQQLKSNKDRLKVLGNGHQRKSYLHINDCINGMKVAIENTTEKVNIFNLGVDATCEVRDSIRWITEKLGVNPEIDFGTETRGWIGDNPLIHLSTKKINALGWSPKFSIQDGVEDTISFFLENDWLFDAK